ncbi:MAG: acetolactate synthase small subunit [Candidatus Omnitrophica bacterium]|nr:acetolactate synthase small subunit [Candidatus Omnitrophota bacterium]
MEEKQHIISVTVENRFGVLARIAGLFSARGFNIDSLSVAETEDPTVSQMTIGVRGNERILEQIIKQLNKLIDVIKVQDLTSSDHLERELILVKVNATNRANITKIVETFGSQVIDVGQKSVVIELVGDSHRIQMMLKLLRPFGIKEIIRTGKVGIRGEGEK